LYFVEKKEIIFDNVLPSKKNLLVDVEHASADAGPMMDGC
jgi:hypothetical protein